MATASNELITMQGAHSLTETLHPGIILYSRGNTDALLPLCDSDLEAGEECSFRNGLKVLPAPLVPSRMAPISRCFAERQCWKWSLSALLCSRSQCPAGLAFPAQLFQLLAPNSSKSPLDDGADAAWPGCSLQVPSNSRYPVMPPLKTAPFCSE